MNHHKNNFFDYLKNLFLYGDKTIAKLVILVFSALPYTCVLIFSALNFAISTKIILLAIALSFFGSGFIGILSLVRSKESTGIRKTLSILFGIITLLVLWTISFMTVYLTFFMLK